LRRQEERRKAYSAQETETRMRGTTVSCNGKIQLVALIIAFRWRLQTNQASLMVQNAKGS